MKIFRTLFFSGCLLLACFCCSSPSSKATLLGIKDFSVYPETGYKEIIDFINQATSSIDIVVYEFKDDKIADELVAAKDRGVKVRIMLDDHGSNIEEKNHLESLGLDVKFGNPKYVSTQQKTLIVDVFTKESKALILTFNFEPLSFTKSRDFSILLTNVNAVREIYYVFNSDWNREASEGGYPGLVWSPDNARDEIFGLIKYAEHSIDIYGTYLEDEQIEQLLIRAVQNGIKVRALYSPMHRYYGGMNKAAMRGVEIRLSKSIFINGKAILVDKNQAFVGSQNLLTTSLDEYRELGIITRLPLVTKKISEIFEKDWSSSSDFIKFVD
jgi:cardiolipin synthase